MYQHRLSRKVSLANPKSFLYKRLERKPRLENGYLLVPLNDEWTITAKVDIVDEHLVTSGQLITPSRAGYASKGSKLLHRLIINSPLGLHTDHINGDRLDNRRANLRVCTHAENARNRGGDSRNKSGYKGVNSSKNGKRWMAYIRLAGKTTNLGTYDTKEEAARAYDEAALSLHGEFAWLNFSSK